MTMRLQCQRGTDEINHGGTRYVVNNVEKGGGRPRALVLARGREIGKAIHGRPPFASSPVHQFGTKGAGQGREARRCSRPSSRRY